MVQKVLSFDRCENGTGRYIMTHSKVILSTLVQLGDNTHVGTNSRHTTAGTLNLGRHSDLYSPNHKSKRTFFTFIRLSGYTKATTYDVDQDC